ncbi:JAB1/Mov34/MPN/PAD-1 ubiquitin protease-domain-containing protein [Lineolata rhizophorae]|uniref:COP9 signalosome complex subunit 5 n=1 Tax=Lineolata rhizophorae TaxID=578093 RepID=A0A6A6PDJ4_9PEZI|nr:JAB1/Mov34/MPN/PAD-1 ubiquitin protease-domain-containing protein [Lineolata rhizophorae]
MSTAQKAWELENAIQLVDPQRDALYGRPSAEEQAALNNRPWRDNPNYFKKVRISAVALLKMVMHARSGGSIEVMGLMQGNIRGDTFIVTDAFRLPVEGTETRVNAQEDANEYMVEYTRLSRESDQMDNVVGWYHSHPGYGCWLSGIDVTTQATQQMFQDPFLAVVVDPDRTISAGQVEIGAFRTYPENYRPDAAAATDDFQAIPLGKVEDFGAHSSRYYSLDVSHYKSTLDSSLLESLWNKYWVGTLSSSPLFSNRVYGTKQIEDLARKVKQAEAHAGMFSNKRKITSAIEKDPELDRLVKTTEKISSEEQAGLMSMQIKEKVFNNVLAAGNGTDSHAAKGMVTS